MSKLAIVALTLAAMLFVFSQAQQNCGDRHSRACDAGIDSCCRRLQSLNFTCLCSNTFNITKIANYARRTCNIRVPQLGQCQESCREGASEEDFDRTRIICGAGIDSCCRRLRSLNFDCMCSPNSGVTVPRYILNITRTTCRITVDPVPKCPA